MPGTSKGDALLVFDFNENTAPSRLRISISSAWASFNNCAKF
jgi:hypothetical protein